MKGKNIKTFIKLKKKNDIKVLKKKNKNKWKNCKKKKKIVNVHLTQSKKYLASGVWLSR